LFICIGLFGMHMLVAAAQGWQLSEWVIMVRRCELEDTKECCSLMHAALPWEVHVDLACSAATGKLHMPDLT
jgi:hypothetical protein